MRAGEALPASLTARITDAVDAARASTGLRVALHLGEVTGDGRTRAQAWAASLGRQSSAGALVVVVDPQSREIHIATSPLAALRLDAQHAGLAALAATTSFAVGDLAGGITGCLRLLAEACGPAGGALPSAEVRARLGA